MAGKKNEEWFDTVLFRPLGRMIAKALLPTGVTANQVSLASGALGIVAGILIGLQGIGCAIGGAVLFVMLALDCADGELARMRGGGGWRGRMVDGLADLLTAVAVHHGIFVHLAFGGPTLFGYRLHPGLWYLILGLAGASFTWNSGVLDALKQRLNPSSVDDRVDEFRSDVKTLWDRWLFWMLLAYTGQTGKVPDRGTASTQFRFDWIRWVGPTAHQLWMAIAAVAAMFSPDAFVVYLVVTIGPANIYLVVIRMISREPQARRYEPNW